jgi:hypothetical protein
MVLNKTQQPVTQDKRDFRTLCNYYRRYLHLNLKNHKSFFNSNKINAFEKSIKTRFATEPNLNKNNDLEMVRRRIWEIKHFKTNTKPFVYESWCSLRMLLIQVFEPLFNSYNNGVILSVIKYTSCCCFTVHILLLYGNFQCTCNYG